MSTSGPTTARAPRYVRWLAFAIVGPLIMGGLALLAGHNLGAFLRGLEGSGVTVPGVGAEVRISPESAPDEVPVEWTVTGLPANTPVTVKVSMPDQDGVEWTASAVFDSGDKGVVSAHDGPTSGAYTGVDPMGLFSLVQPPNPASGDPSDPTDPGEWFDGGDEWTATMTVSVNGSKVAQGQVDRAWAPDIDGRDLTVADDGISGEYVFPYDGPTKAPVLVIGGWAGSDTSLAEHLAQEGHPTLALDYYGVDGLPDDPENVPIEYFAKALAYLRGQDGVQSQRLVVIGENIGTEAAQLLAIAHPGQVHGLILANPSPRASPADRLGKTPLWTIGGKPVPFLDPTGSRPADDPSILRTDKANAFVVTVCGTLDTVAQSCSGARELTALLTDAHYAQPVHQIEAPTIGASVETFLPYLPHTQAWGGGSLQAEAVELPKVWAQVLRAIDGDGQLT